MRFTAFKAKGRELLCTKFQVSKAVDVDKTRVLFTCTCNDLSSGETLCTSVQSRLHLKRSCAVENRGKNLSSPGSEPLEPLSTSGRLMKTNCECKSRRTSKLIETIPKQFKWGLTMVRGIATTSSLSADYY